MSAKRGRPPKQWNPEDWPRLSGSSGTGSRLHVTLRGDNRERDEPDELRRVIDADEGGKILKIAEEEFGWERDVGAEYEIGDADCEFLESIWRLQSSYEATAEALGNGRAIREEAKRMRSIQVDARCVIDLLEAASDLTNPEGCLREAARLQERLSRFPPQIRGEITGMKQAGPFRAALARLRDEIVYVHRWKNERDSLLLDLLDLVATLDSISTDDLRKRLRDGRPSLDALYELERGLRELYMERIQPLREREWEGRHRVEGDRSKPPRPTPKAFAIAMMKALGINLPAYPLQPRQSAAPILRVRVRLKSPIA